MRNLVFDMSTMHLHGSAFHEFLKLRKHLLVDTLKWDVPNDGVAEMDQYDTPIARYSLVEHEGAIVAGARTMPTSASWGRYTCMLRDAAEGRIEGVPGNLFNTADASPELWECTRLVITDRLTSMDDRTRCLALLVDGLVAAVREFGGKRMTSLSPLPLQRALRRLGYDCERISEPYRSEQDGRTYAVLTMTAEHHPEVLRSLGLIEEDVSASRRITAA